MDSMRWVFLTLGVEIPLFCYTISTYFKAPVYSNLVYEKLCLAKYNNSIFCSNISYYNDDKDIQKEYANFYWISSYGFYIPSLIATLSLGVLTDRWNPKIPLVIPFVGAIISTLNCIIQSIYLNFNIYFFLIGDVIFGACGGYIFLLSTGLCFGVKSTGTNNRSVRLAGIDGALGLGVTFGYAFSGIIRQAFGYTSVFLLILCLQILAVIYISLMIATPQAEEDLLQQELTTTEKLKEIFTGFYRMLSNPRNTRLLLILNIIVQALDVITYTGIGEIQYSYLRFKFAWSDKEYGLFCGLSALFSTITVRLCIIFDNSQVIFLFPYLRFKGYTCSQLGAVGIVTKIISILLLAVILTPSMIYAVIATHMFSRFISSGYRGFLCSLIENNEQRKLFYLLALQEGVLTLVSAAIYSFVYPLTLHFFPGFMLVLSGILLLPSIGIVSYSDWKIKQLSEEETTPAIQVRDEE